MVTGGRIQGFTPSGGGGHSAFVQSGRHKQHKLSILFYIIILYSKYIVVFAFTQTALLVDVN